MAKYHVSELTKASHQQRKNSSEICQPKPSFSATQSRRRCNTHRFRWPDCPRPLRDGRREWCLPPSRYRLGGSFADLAQRATGVKAGQGNPVKACYPIEHAGRVRGTMGNSNSHRVDDINAINVPTEMNKLLHPRKYFVGKIRPGDRMNDRPTMRLALSDPMVCYREPTRPGPGQYDPEKAQQQSRPRDAANKKPSHPACCYTYDLYCREPFFRPPAGRYDIRGAPSPLASGQSRHGRELLHIPPIRYGPVTIRLNSIDIPVRPRKGRRNMKVAFLSGSARFKDRDFFPIGGLGKATTDGSSAKRPGNQKVGATTSNKSANISPQLEQISSPQEWKEASPAASATPRPSLGEKVDEQTEGDANVEVKVEKARVSEDLVQLLVGYGISRGDLPALTKRKIPTKFFTVPKLARARVL